MSPTGNDPIRESPPQGAPRDESNLGSGGGVGPAPADAEGQPRAGPDSDSDVKLPSPETGFRSEVAGSSNTLGDGRTAGGADNAHRRDVLADDEDKVEK